MKSSVQSGQNGKRHMVHRNHGTPKLSLHSGKMRSRTSSCLLKTIPGTLFRLVQCRRSTKKQRRAREVDQGLQPLQQSPYDGEWDSRSKKLAQHYQRLKMYVAYVVVTPVQVVTVVTVVTSNSLTSQNSSYNLWLQPRLQPRCISICSSNFRILCFIISNHHFIHPKGYNLTVGCNRWL